MKNIIKQLREKTVGELEKETRLLREETAKLKLEFKTNLPKDTNILVKKRKQLARTLMTLTEKLEVEKLRG